MDTARLVAVLIMLVWVVTACSSDPSTAQGPAGSTATPMPPLNQESEPATRLASHLFLAAGSSYDLSGLGRFLEAVHMTEPAAVEVEGVSLRGLTGGSSCLRFRYRVIPGENGVQTLCVTVIDEAASCARLPRQTLDLQRFLDSPQRAIGNANLLEAGAGRFYSVCRTEASAYRLQQPSEELPPLYLHMVDALGDGPYSLGTNELAAQRSGAIVTYSGEELRPPWIVTVSRELDRIELTPQGFTVNDEDCTMVPSCTPHGDTVLPGDFLRIGYGLPLELMDALLATSAEAVAAHFQRTTALDWTEVLSVHPSVSQAVLIRLFNLEAMEQLVRHFDEVHSLRQKGVRIAYSPFWAVRAIPGGCYPDTEEQDRCQRIEAALAAAEERSVAALRDEGFRLWLAAPIDYDAAGQYRSIDAEVRPHYSLFEGFLGNTMANSAALVEDIPATLAAAMRAFAGELGPEMPVVVMMSGPLITAQTGSAFCEAQVCPSDFKGAYEQTEAWLGAALDSFAPGQLVGFGVAMFEGSHFDIRSPYEDYGAFLLNRVGETGYNQPLVNIYRAQ